jgi:hypothetical protein
MHVLPRFVDKQVDKFECAAVSVLPITRVLHVADTRANHGLLAKIFRKN